MTSCHVACLNFKTSCVGVHKCLSLSVGLAVTVAIWPREVVSCCGFILRAVATFWTMSLVGIDPGRVSIIFSRNITLFWNNHTKGATLLVHNPLSPSVLDWIIFPSSYSWNKAKLRVSRAWWLRNRGDNNGKLSLGRPKGGGSTIVKYNLFLPQWSTCISTAMTCVLPLWYKMYISFYLL